MDVVTNNRICRCCYAEGTFKDLISTHLWMGESEVYGDIIKECFDIHLLNIADDESSGICELCIISLRNANHFKKQVLKSEELFKKNLLEDKNSVKLEEAINAGGNVNVEVEIDHVPDYVPHKFEELELPIKSEIHFTDELTIKKKKRKLKTESNTSDKRHDIQGAVDEATFRFSKEKYISETQKQYHNLKQILQYSNVTPFRGRDVFGYNCAFCNNSFQDPNDLRTHTKEEHVHDKLSYKQGHSLITYSAFLDIDDLKCTICELSVVDIRTLSEHLVKNHNKIYYDVADYLQQFKLDKESLQCCQCKKVFNSFKMLAQHMNFHYSNFLCSICGSGFVNRFRMERHLETHSKKSCFACLYCTETFQSEHKRRVHVEKMHRNYRNKCRLCSERFPNYYQKSLHMNKVHNFDKHQCKACEKQFVARNLLELHIRRDHLLERSFECEVCRLRFFTKKRLAEHKVVHTREKDFKCEICERLFARKRNLIVHMKVHLKSEVIR